MFLYWRKRGAYELEALPSALAELELGAVERFSWSSTLDIIEDLGGRHGPTFLGGLAGGPDTWPTWPPPCDWSLWPNQQPHATAGHSLNCGAGFRAPPEGGEEGGLSTGTLGHQGQQQSALGFRPGLCLHPPPPSPGPCGGASFWDVYVQGQVSLLPLSPLWTRKQHRD